MALGLKKLLAIPDTPSDSVISLADWMVKTLISAMHFDEPSPEEFNFRLPHALEFKARYASHQEYWIYPHLPIPSFIRIYEDHFTIDGWFFHYRDFTRRMLHWLRLTLDEWFLMNTSTWFRDWIMEIMSAIFESVQHWRAHHKTPSD